MLFPFGNLNNQKFLGFVNNNNDNNNESKNSNSFLILKPPPDLALLFNQFNNAIPENNNDPENVIQSKYYDIDELQQLKIPNKEKSLSLFHINSCSLNKNFEELQNLLQSTNAHGEDYGFEFCWVTCSEVWQGKQWQWCQMKPIDRC